MIFKVYELLTKRTVKITRPPEDPEAAEVRPAFMRDTASKRLKDPEIDRIQDNVERTIRAIDTLGNYHEERRVQKATEAPLLIQQHRQTRMAQGTEYDTTSKEEVQDSLQLSEVRVKALASGAAALQGKGGARGGEGQKSRTAGIKQQLLQAVGAPQSSVGALAGMQQPALFVKPAADIMRPLVLSIVQDSEELSRAVDSRKDVVVSFMEQCREGVPDAGRADRHATSERLREIEETSVKVFETLANRAQLLVEPLTKSPPEFWKVWSTFYPALTDFPETSPVFESAVFLFKRLGHLMREADAPLTQQLMTEVGLPSLAKELVRAPEKRECLCEVIYSYTQEDTLNHLLVLRALKDKLGDNLPVYVSCLSCLISLDAQLSLLDEHLLDLYVYYALMAMQRPQPRTRVAGISILHTITTCSSQHHSIVALVPNFAALANDEWWEVQAQLLLLSASLLSKLTLSDMDWQDGGSADDASGSAGSKVADGADPLALEVAQESLLAVISHLFVVSGSKNVLQVGLSALVHLLPEFPNLLPMYVTVLLEQSPNYRQRLLRPTDAEGDYNLGRKTYVWGNASRMYEEKCVSHLWPHLDVAKTLAMQLDTSPLDCLQTQHMEVLTATLPDIFKEPEVEEWLSVFDKMKRYIFDALIDPELHQHSAQFIKRFWTSESEALATASVERSKKVLLQALKDLYSHTGRAKVNEAEMVAFLQDMKAFGGELAVEVVSVVESFRDTLPNEFANSSLGILLAS
uniref:Uncharacterized protein n=1 Tax=Zooxanthella nutricula TaxID=1333877 RepID=A0A7S2NP71_9DINO